MDHGRHLDHISLMQFAVKAVLGADVLRDSKTMEKYNLETLIITLKPRHT